LHRYFHGRWRDLDDTSKLPSSVSKVGLASLIYASEQLQNSLGLEPGDYLYAAAGYVGVLDRADNYVVGRILTAKVSDANGRSFLQGDLTWEALGKARPHSRTACVSVPEETGRKTYEIS
jgi:hypothetical protein